MTERTFGWVQEAYTIPNLKNLVRVFVPNSTINRLLKENKIPRLISKENGAEDMMRFLDSDPICVPYVLLKGKGTPKGYTRSNAPCSGIIQAVLKGQRKEYQSDWPADSFLRWAISIGMLKYDRDNDTCSITELGNAYANSEDGSNEECEILTQAFLSYPPVCRILNLLSNGQVMTKFEIGSQLGFVGEAGFTSVPQHLILQGLKEAATPEERNKLLSDTEGTSDKYVRTICAWLKGMGWVNQVPKTVSENVNGNEYSDIITQAYQLTLKGKKIAKHTTGASKYKRIDKRILWDMLATKPSDRNYLRNRRAYLIQYLSSSYRTLEEVKAHLAALGLKEDVGTIADDVKGLANVGLNVSKNGNKYKIMDTIIDLEIPNNAKNATEKSDLSTLKDEIRKQLVHVNHKYLVLIDLGFDGNADRDYEIETADLLTSELDFKGGRLGDTRKPDVCVHLSDFHLGKRINEYSMLEDQEYILKKIINIIDEEKPEGIIIAGDIYDKAVPPVEAVQLFDDFIFQLSQRKTEVFIISGNHDSPERISFGSRIMDRSGIHISKVYDGNVLPLSLHDEYGTVDVFMLPFIKPANVRCFCDDNSEKIVSYTDSVKFAISKMNINPDNRNILITHQFVTGALRTESEEISVGGSDNVDSSVFDQFDYVALGHIHSPQICGSERIRYSGTPLKYSFSEAKDHKSVAVIELTNKGNISCKKVELVPQHDMVELKGTYGEITLKSFYDNTTWQEDYTHITLTDEEDIPDAIGKLRSIYHRLMKLDYDNKRTRSNAEISTASDTESKSPLKLFSDFYVLQNNQSMSDEQTEFMKSMIEKIWEETR